MPCNPIPDGCQGGIHSRPHLDDNGFTRVGCPLISRLTSIWRAIHSSTSVSIQPTALAPNDTGLGNLPSATRRYVEEQGEELRLKQNDRQCVRCQWILILESAITWPFHLRLLVLGVPVMTHLCELTNEKA
jgi:hypothetical protein